MRRYRHSFDSVGVEVDLFNRVYGEHPDLGTMGGYDTSPPGIFILLMVIAVAALVVVTR